MFDGARLLGRGDEIVMAVAGQRSSGQGKKKRSKLS
jgi:hypothetical protein